MTPPPRRCLRGRGRYPSTLEVFCSLALLFAVGGTFFSTNLTVTIYNVSILLDIPTQRLLLKAVSQPVTLNPQGIRQIPFFDMNVNNQRRQNQKKGMAACLINLEDTIRLAEWLPYHYTVLPLQSLVIALDPMTSSKGVNRTLQLIDLWKDRIDITLWPDFELPDEERKRERVPYIRERQVYFAKQCLVHHKRHNASWTLLTDNDEYLTFNYIHETEEDASQYFPKKDKYKKRAAKERKKYMPLRRQLPSLFNHTILDFLDEHSKSFERCVRIPYIRYGGGAGASTISAKNGTAHSLLEDPRLLTTIHHVHHTRRLGKASKVMIDLRRVAMKDLQKKDKAKTIHNPNRRVCGGNSAVDSGTDYLGAVFRMNHYIGSLESFLERQADYRGRSLTSFHKRASEVNQNMAFDHDLVSWVDAFVEKVGTIKVREMLKPLEDFVKAERASFEMQNLTVDGNLTETIHESHHKKRKSRQKLASAVTMKRLKERLHNNGA